MSIHAKYSLGRLSYYNSGNSGGIDYGTSSAEVSTSTANVKFMSLYTKSTAASGDTRAIYAKLNLAGTTAGNGYGDAVRAYAFVTGTGYANAVGIHATAAIDESATATGQAAGVRATLEATSESRTLAGTLSSLICDSYVGANNTLPTGHAFIRFVDVGSVRFTNLFIVPNASNGTIFAAHVTQTMSHSLKIISADGTPYYIMCTDTATNRS